MKRIVSAAVALTLFLQPLASIPAGPARAQDAPIGDDAPADPSIQLGARLLRQAETHERAIETLLRRAKHPNTPGTQGGVPGSAEIRAMEERVRSWKTEVQSALGLPSLPPDSGNGPFLELDFKLAAAESYLSLLAQLITLRITLDLPYGADWRAAFELEIPSSSVDELPGLFTEESERTGDRYFSLLINEVSGRARLRLSESMIHGIELGALASRPSSGGFLTMVQYLALRQLYQNLTDLGYLRRGHAIQYPAIPDKLARKLRTFSRPEELIEEQRTAMVEPALRALLVRSYDTIARDVPRTIDAALALDIARALLDLPAGSQDPEARRIAELIQAELESGNAWTFTEGLESNMNAASRLVSMSEGTERIRLLKQVLGNSKETAVLKTLIFLAAKGVIRLNEPRSRRISALTRERRADFMRGLDDGVIQRWVDEANARLDAHLGQDRRNEFIESLFVESKVLSLVMGDGLRDERVDFSILSRSFAEKIEQLQPREEMRDWVADIGSSGSYAEARDRYARIVLRETYPAVVKDGIVDPGLVKLYADAGDLKPRIPEFDSLSEDIREFMLGRVELARRKNLRDLIKYGEWAGFHSRPALENPKVSQILSKEEDRRKYGETLRESIRSEYPVLAEDVTAPNPDYGRVEWACSDGPGGERCHNIYAGEPRERSFPLYQVLARLNPDNTSDPRLLEEAQPYVETALAAVEANIRRNVGRIAEAETLKDVEAVVKSSLMIQLVMSVSPEFRRLRDDWIEQVNHPTVLDLLVREDVGFKLTAGFAALGLIQLAGFIGPAKPFVKTFNYAFRPFIRGFTNAATAIMLAEGAYEYHHLRRQSRLNDDVQSLFASSAEGGGFVRDGEARAMRSDYQWAKWMFIGRMVLDTAFFYLPEGSRIVNKLGRLVRSRELVADIRAFRALEIEPGKWNKLDRALHRMRRRAQAGKVTPEALSDAERAHARLRAKRRAGTDWSLPPRLDSENLTPRERLLRELLEKEGHFR